MGVDIQSSPPLFVALLSVVSVTRDHLQQMIPQWGQEVGSSLT